MIIDLRELAKSLMFAEKAKEEAEELRRDNERLYEVTVEYAKRFEKDNQTILNLRQTILNLERKVQFLEEGAENLSGALINVSSEVSKTIAELLVSRNLVGRDTVFGIALLGKVNMLANYITAIEVERDESRKRYEAIREILLPIWSEQVKD